MNGSHLWFCGERDVLSPLQMMFYTPYSPIKTNQLLVFGVTLYPPLDTDFAYCFKSETQRDSGLGVSGGERRDAGDEEISCACKNTQQPVLQFSPNKRHSDDMFINLLRIRVWFANVYLCVWLALGTRCGHCTDVGVGGHIVI